MPQIIRVSMSAVKVEVEEASKDYLFWGGRGLIAKIMNDEVAPTCDPWGKGNKLRSSLPWLIQPGVVRLPMGFREQRYP